MSKNPLLKVVILGDGGVGKSCLMNRFVSNSFDEHCFHTIGVEFLTKELLVDGTTYTLQIWDTAGQERFKTLRTPFYRGSDICMLTYAVDNKKSFANLAMWWNEFKSYSDSRNAEPVPFIVVGNKSDLPLSKREVSREEADSWCSANGFPLPIETSARNADNVQQAFEAAVGQWGAAERRAEQELRFSAETVDLRRTAKEGLGMRLRPACCANGGDAAAREDDGVL